MISKCDVVTPHVKLPFAQSQNAAKNVASMDAYAHVHIEASSLAYYPDNIDINSNYLCMKH